MFNNNFRKIFFSMLLGVVLFTSCKNVQPTEYYNEAHRNQFHFSPIANWMNDPNGMVYFEGEYHLFYQYYPDSTVWGPMHWGHAISKDLIRWQHLPIALYPDSLGLIFSGSCVIDKNNTAGFGKNAMVAIFTHHHMALEKEGSSQFQHQSIAYSTDKGRTFTKYNGNPVIKNPGIKDFRDPKVIWDDERQQWVMVFAAYDKVLFYASKNLKIWTKTGEFGIENDTRLWECPDLFKIKVEETGEDKWVLITSIQKNAPNGGTATSYFVGDFNGNTFNGDSKKQKWLDYGKDNYAFVTWSNVPDSRILGLGWMSNWQYAQVVPTQKWRSAMTLPRSITLHKIADDFMIKSLPVKEIESIYKSEETLNETNIVSNVAVYKTENPYKLNFSFKKPKNGKINIRLSNQLNEEVIIGYATDSNRYFVNRINSGNSNFSNDFAGIHYAPCNYNDSLVNMQIYIDRASIEMFADSGKTTMTEIMFPKMPYNKIEILANTNEVYLLKGVITKLKKIW